MPSRYRSITRPSWLHIGRVLQASRRGQLFSALGERGISIRLIEQDTDENCVVLGVADEDFAPAVRVLYDRFIGR